MSVRIVHRHHFSSALGRMSVIAQVKGLQEGSHSEAGMCLVKGSPEAIGPLLATSGEGAKPAWFEATYTGLAEQGLRAFYLNFPFRVAIIGLWTAILNAAQPFEKERKRASGDR